VSDVERLTEVLRAHAGTGRTGGGTWGCMCGRVLADDVSNADQRHPGHLAQVLAPLLAEARQEGAETALREAADRWTQGGWSDVMLPKPAMHGGTAVIAYSNRVGDWLRGRADRVAADGQEGGR